MNEHNISSGLILASHENLKRAIAQLKSYKNMENAPEDAFNRVFYELYHSNLIAAGEIRGNKADVAVACGGNMQWMALYTDMDEFRKAFPKLDVSAHQHPFPQYVKYLFDCDLSGLIINIRGDYFALPTDVFEGIDYPLVYDFPADDSYTAKQIKSVKDSIDNSSLEKFIKNPKNVGKYEELFDEISSSTVLTLRLTQEDCSDMIDEGIISMEKTGPLGILYLEQAGGQYAAAFTSDEKMAKIKTTRHKYSQVVNFCQMTMYLLSEDLDGMVINPGDENIILTREVLMEFYMIIAETCHDPKMNSSVFYMFPVEGDS